MIRVITWLDLDGPTFYEAKRSEDNFERWALVRLDVHAQRDPDSIPGEVLLTDASLSEVYAAMAPVLEQLDERDAG